MFGFLPAPCATCHQAEHSTYRKYFCGLSSALAREYGPAARFLTNRDGAFFSILAASQGEGEPSATVTTCCNPLGKKRELYDSGVHASYAAAVSVCGVSTKLRDDAEDESGTRKYLGAIGASLMKRSVSKATAVLDSTGFPSARIHSEMRDQARLEGLSGGDWMKAAAPASSAFSAIFGHCGRLGKGRKGERQIKCLGALGRALGRIIYLVDAVEDRAEDERKHRFNPLQKSTDLEAKYWFEEEYGELFWNFEKLETGPDAGLLRSILVDGVFAKSASILGMSIAGQPDSKKKKKDRKRGDCWDYCDCCSFCDCCPSSACDCDCCPCDCS